MPTPSLYRGALETSLDRANIHQKFKQLKLTVLSGVKVDPAYKSSTKFWTKNHDFEVYPAYKSNLFSKNAPHPLMGMK